MGAERSLLLRVAAFDVAHVSRRAVSPFLATCLAFCQFCKNFTIDALNCGNSSDPLENLYSPAVSRSPLGAAGHPMPPDTPIPSAS